MALLSPTPASFILIFPPSYQSRIAVLLPSNLSSSAETRVRVFLASGQQQHCPPYPSHRRCWTALLLLYDNTTYLQL